MPTKTHEMHNHHMDSTIWNDFPFRNDDIILATYAKSGTTWMQQIVGQLIFAGAEDMNLAAMSPWMDLRVPPKHVKLAEVEAQPHRRFLKTHLPVEALVFSDKAKYLYVARDGRDMVWSLYNHHRNASAKWYGALNETPGLVGPKIDLAPDDIREYFQTWLARDGFPFWSFWENIRSWWAIRELPNVKLLHFSDLKADLAAEIDGIAQFLDIRHDAETLRRITAHCGFNYMKERADSIAPLGGTLWEGGGKTFIHKGTNGRWRDTLSVADSAAYEARALAELGSDCAGWLAHGTRAATRAAA